MDAAYRPSNNRHNLWIGLFSKECALVTRVIASLGVFIFQGWQNVSFQQVRPLVVEIKPVT